MVLRSCIDSSKFSIKEGFSDDPAAQYEIIEEHIFNLLKLNEESFNRLVMNEGKTEPFEPLFRSSPAKSAGGAASSPFNPYGTSSSGSSNSGAKSGAFHSVPLEPPSRVTVSRPPLPPMVTPMESQATSSSQWNTQNYAPPINRPRNSSSSSVGGTAGHATSRKEVPEAAQSSGQKRKIENFEPPMHPVVNGPPPTASNVVNAIQEPSREPAVSVVPKPTVPVVMALTQPLQVSQAVSALLQDDEW